MKNAAAKTKKAFKSAVPDAALEDSKVTGLPAQANDNAPEYVDDRTLAARTPISRVGWQTWRSRGTGPRYYKVGKRCLYKWHEVVAWLESHSIEPKAS